MHMNMNLAPVTQELEKLRSFISQLVEKQGNDKTDSSRHMNILEEFKGILNHENNEIKAQLQSYHDKLSSTKQENDILKLENAKLAQKMHSMQNELLNL